MTFGLYKHYRGGWYLGLWLVSEATNSQPNDRKMLYFSFAQKRFFVRKQDEFFEGPIFTITGPLIKKSIQNHGYEPVWRFTRIFPPYQPFNSLR